MSLTPFKILVFDFNSGGVRWCETGSQAQADKNRSGFRALLFKPPCVAPDFFESIRNSILGADTQPDLVVFSTQEEASSGTYFHSDFLPSRMPDIGYALLKREVLEGVGEIPSGNPILGKDSGINVGNVTNSAIRMSIYVKPELVTLLRSSERRLDQIWGNKGQDTLTCRSGERKSGAICAYVWHPTFGHFAFINVQLPSGAGVVRAGRDYATFREGIKASNKICLINIMNQFVNDVYQYNAPDHVILMGDMNYELVVPDRRPLDVASVIANNLTANGLRDIYQKYDELAQAIKELPLRQFKEGVGGQGPIFMPTWKLLRNRPSTCSPKKDQGKLEAPVDQCFDVARQGVSFPAWRDRILFGEFGSSNYTLNCQDYQRIDTGNMNKSTHAGVIGLFTLVARA
jgi:hypothetical protein